MFFDVTRAGTDRPLRVAVAAIAYLDTLPNGCVLHLVGGQGLQVAESATEVEDRAKAARPITALQYGDRRVEYGWLTHVQIQDGDVAALRDALDRGPGAIISLPEHTGIEAEIRQAGVDWTEVLASGLGGDAAPADAPETAAVPAPTPSPAPKRRRRRGQPS